MIADKFNWLGKTKQVDMNKVAKIKVVKRNDVKASESVKSVAKDRRSSREAAREMVSTVSDWVTEFKHRKSEETRAAIEMLIQPRPQTSGS